MTQRIVRGPGPLRPDPLPRRSGTQGIESTLVHGIGSIVQDLRAGARALARSPGFSWVALGVLTVGIGLNVFSFGAVNALLFKPLPFPDGHRIVSLDARLEGSSGGTAASLADFFDWRDRQHAFSALAAIRPTRATLEGGEGAETVEALAVTADFFSVFGVFPAAGRTFVSGDDLPGAPPVVVLSDRLWRRRYQAAPVVGSSLRVDGELCTVIGIMSAGFGYPDRTQLWFPLEADRATLNRAQQNVWAVARLRPGRTLEEARAEMQTIGEQLVREYPQAAARLGPRVIPVRQAMIGTDLRLAVVLSSAAAGFVLLIGCANLVNLVLARGLARGREMAVRAALGASRLQLVRHLLAEGLLIGVGGMAGGLILGALGLRAVRILLPADPPDWLRLDLDPTVVGYAVLLMLATTLVVGWFPALQASRPSLRDGLSASGGPTTSSGVGRVHRVLVTLEMALALVLLVSAGLMTRALVALLLAEPGFRTENVLTLRVSLPGGTYSRPDSRRQFYSTFLDAVRHLPGVREAGAGSRLPSQQANWVPMVIPEGTAAESVQGRFPAHAVVVTPGYFETLGIPVLQGRAFNALDDRPGTVASVVVNRTFVDRHWPTGNPIGRRLKFWLGPNANDESDWLTVVGVVGDVLNARHNAPITIYLPLDQVPVRDLALVVAGSSDPSALLPEIRRVSNRLDGGVPLSEVRTMEAVVDEFRWETRLFTRLFGVSGMVALGLAALGVYGVVAYGLGRRTREIGIRTALGATRGVILRFVLGQGLAPAVVGIGIGLGFSLVVTRFLRSLLVGVSPTDPLSFVVMTGVLLVAAFLACYGPARRASRIDAVQALRQE